MRINHKILSIPPYLSTSWKNILSLQAESRGGNNYVLFVTLIEGSKVEIPDLEQSVVDTVFAAHARFHEIEQASPRTAISSPQTPQEAITNLGFPLKLGFGIEGLGSALQHNQEQYDSPDIPIDVLNKISSLTKAMGIEEISALPKPEPHCNCPHCQIARAVQRGVNDEDLLIEKADVPPLEEEVVSDADLTFRSWDIVQTAQNLYTVSNPFDTKEYYNVFLGKPVGCTCGSKNCEHIRAVLNS